MSVMNQTKKKTGLKKCIKAPYKMFVKAKDLCIRSMTRCSSHVGQEFAFGFPTAGAGHVHVLPRSFSANSTRSINRDEDFRRLVRFSSVRRRNSRQIDLDIHRAALSSSSSPSSSSSSPLSSSPSRSQFSPRARMKRNYSVGMGKIDENKACEFYEEAVFQKSKSCK